MLPQATEEQNLQADQPEATDRELIDRKELARRMRINIRTVAKWQDEGMPVARRGTGRRSSLFVEAEVRAWRQQLDEAASVGGEAIDLNAARARKEHWQACLAEQLHAMRARTLLPADEVEKAWTAHVAAARNVLLAAAVSHVDRVHRAGVLEGAVGTERELKAMVHEALRELAGISGTEPPPKSADSEETRPRRRANRTERKRKERPSRRVPAAEDVAREPKPADTNPQQSLL